MNSAIKQITDTKFLFDGVVYYNKHFLSKKDKLRNLLSTSIILSGKPRKNELYWAFCVHEFQDNYTIKFSKRKIIPEGTVYMVRGKLYDLLDRAHSGKLAWEAAQHLYGEKN